MSRSRRPHRARRVRLKTWDLERRILAAWKDATTGESIAGRDWYQLAHDECLRIAQESGQSVSTVAGVVAAISPGLRWSRNIFWARELVIAWPEGRAEELLVPTYSKGNTAKAVRILAGESPESVLRGPKVTAFYRLIRDRGANELDVCVDGHAYALATGWGGAIRSDPYSDAHDPTKTVRISKPELRRVTQAYIRLARKLVVYPNVLQATTWLVRKRWREEGEIV